ncbi:MAG: tetratricopeptide repeat protein [Candidatus Eisenbacteria bacterium]|uniref:Tetratricopeptide repeat protein n=1 Tax=Eiseniibacteriota bacterium TaxID=2212470 RepID=A0A538UEA5_UNCEI|nr:MAG: tetratricopeptide repeat protein [Candidatus Eisenbacteria bacterium]
MDKSIEIKRQAQRSIQSGDLDGALAAYERLVGADDSDPYNYILLADLLYKKGDQAQAIKRYLTATACYEKSGLYKNAIAVAKKMLRLSLSNEVVLDRLAALHALDGLGTEATLYYTQLAEHFVRENKFVDAAGSLRKGFDSCPDNIKSLERLAEVHALADNPEASARTLAEAAYHYRRAGQESDADRCGLQAERLLPGSVAAFVAEVPPPPPAAPAPAAPPSAATFARTAPEPGGRLGATDVAPPDVVAADDGSVDDDTTALETEGPPRFVPPKSDAVIRQDIEHHSRATAAPAAAPPPPASPPPAVNGADAGFEMPKDLKGVERLLGLAQTEFRAGNRERAATILTQAAQAFEAFDRLDNAASIYRSLCNGPHATPQMMELWLRNCERREDRREAGQVACDLGDRALQEDDLDRARAWFERAARFDQNNLVARRRLERLGPGSTARLDEVTAPVAREPEPEPELSQGSADGKVHVALDRSQAVSYDLASTLAEFQRGVESLLSGDAQAHYDLAVAYREMGLTQQAIESFRFAAKEPAFKLRAAEMIGHCLLEEGRFEDAARELGEALADTALDAASGVGIRFQLGLALEAAGRLPEALAEFERVFEVQASYPDAAQKVRALRKHLEAA